jgi:hypothetical protein
MLLESTSAWEIFYVISTKFGMEIGHVFSGDLMVRC